jgi:2-alkyl-3-oxoalkanoate reductase
LHVFVAGATGVIGRALIPRLLAAGHAVTGLARSPEKLLEVDRMGASAVRGDLLDAEALSRIVAERRPDAVVNVATSIPRSLKIDPAEWLPNDLLRSRGTVAIARACEAAGVRLLVQESVGYVCEPRGSDWITEGSPLSPHPFLKATREMEEIVRSSPVPSVILRFAALMSPDAWHTQQTVAALRRGMLPIIGKGDAYVSMIHVEDAAVAILGVLDHADTTAGQTYNVVDDAPAEMADVFAYAASVLGAPAPRSVPPLLAKLAVGGLTLEILAASYRMGNQKLRSDTSFSPRYRTYKETWRQIADADG